MCMHNIFVFNWLLSTPGSMLTAFCCSVLDLSKAESKQTCSAAARSHYISKANRRVCCAFCMKGCPSLLFSEGVNTSIGINIPCLDINQQAVINGRSAAGNKHVERTSVQTMQVNGAHGEQEERTWAEVCWWTTQSTEQVFHLQHLPLRRRLCWSEQRQKFLERKAETITGANHLCTPPTRNTAGCNESQLGEE